MKRYSAGFQNSKAGYLATLLKILAVFRSVSVQLIPSGENHSRRDCHDLVLVNIAAVFVRQIRNDSVD
jgi:hypothetical protein